MSRVILIIDPDEEVRNHLSVALRGAGFDTLTAANGMEGLELFEAQKPSAVVLEFVLPGLMGLSVCARIRAQSEGVPIIMISAVAERLTRGRTGYGVFDFFPKPVEPGRLIDAVHRAMSSLPAQTTIPVDASAAKMWPSNIDTQVLLQSAILAHSIEGSLDASFEGMWDEGMLDEGMLDEGMLDEAPLALDWPPTTEHLAIPEGQESAGIADLIEPAAALDELPESPEAASEEFERWKMQPLLGGDPSEPQGVYGELTFAQLLYRLFRDHFTGRVVIDRGIVHRNLYFLDGSPINAASDARSESLGPFLLERQAITRPQYLQALELAAGQGVSQGEALVSIGAFGNHMRARHAETLAHEIFIRCFLCTGMNYGMVYDPAIGQRVAHFEMHPLPMIFEGIDRVMPIGPIVQHFDECSRRILRTTPGLDEARPMLQQYREELRIADLCDGNRTLGAVLCDSPYGMVCTLRVIRCLEIIRAVEFVGIVGEKTMPPGAAPPIDLVSPAETPERPQRKRRFGQATRTQTGIYRMKSSGPKESTPPDRSSAPPRAAPEAPSAPPAELPPVVKAPRARTQTGAQRVVQRPTAPQRPVAQDDGARQPTPAEAARDQIIAAYLRISEADFYQCLEVGSDAGVRVIDAAYKRLTEGWHPSRFSRLDEETQARAKEIFMKISDAYETLRIPQKRSDYDALHLEMPPLETARPDVLQAELNYTRGRSCLDLGELSRAERFFALASKQDAHTAVYRLYHGWACFLLAEPNDKKARAASHDEMKAAVLADAGNDDGFALLGHVYRQSGQTSMAEKFYQKALSINRSNTAARKALAEMQGGGASDSTAPGLLGRLFKK